MSILGELKELVLAVKRLLETGPPEAVAVVLIGGLLLGGGAMSLFAKGRQRPLPGERPPNRDELQTLKDKLRRCEANRDSMSCELNKIRPVIDSMLNIKSEQDVWSLHPPAPPINYRTPSEFSRPKIITIANNKGGVGKTTLTAYLAAYYRAKGKKVLVIDLDYQGSLTTFMLASGHITIPLHQAYRLAHANTLLHDTEPPNWPAEELQDDLAGIQLVTADYTLTNHETKLLLSWLARRGNPDIRYYLATALMGPRVQSATTGFDIVLIDAPPRLTTGTINALAASTHVVVPTILDGLAAETVRSFLRQAWSLKTALKLGVELAGVVATMTPPGQLLAEELTLAEALQQRRGTATALDALSLVNASLAEWGEDPYVFKQDMQRRAEFGHAAGGQIAYPNDDFVTQMIDRLGAELSSRIAL